MKDYAHGYLKEILYNFRLNIIILLIFFIFAVSCFFLLRSLILKNSQELGREISRSYSIEESKNIESYTDFIRRVAILIEQSDTADNSDKWLGETLKALSSANKDKFIDPYVIRRGKIVAANPWEGDEEYNYRDTEWYKKAVAARGKIIFTDTYTDVITGEPIITIAKETSTPGEVVAFDIFLHNFKQLTKHESLPAGSEYFLCDSSGVLLYSKSQLDDKDPATMAFVKKVFDEIKQGVHEDHGSTVTDVNGKERVVYYNFAENGWVSIITIPYHTIIHDAYFAFYVAVFILLIFVAIVCYSIYREYSLNKNIKRFTETISFLGNMYYAIYRVNYKNNTFELIKYAPDIENIIKGITEYDVFLEKIGAVIEPSARDEFLHFFSIANINKLVADNVQEYSGEFQRKFGEGYEWVNARLVVDNSLNKNEVILCFRRAEEEKKQQLKRVELLRSALQSARRSENARNAFFSHMSHDMRTPLNAIIGLSTLAKEHCNTYEEVISYVDKISISSKQLLELINHILDVSRLEQGKISIEYSETNLKKCFEECLGAFFYQAKNEEKVFSVEYEIHNELVLASCFRISQIMNNIVSNAFKYSKKHDSIKVHVKQLDRKKHSQYQIDVIDTGLGMTQEFLDKIFIPYERETRFAAKDVLGTGLGMSIVKNIISNLDGEITIKSELGKGTTVTIILPFESIQEDAAPEATRDVQEMSLKGLNVLLVEDNSINMQIAAKLLEVKGINVYKAWNGEDAIHEFETLGNGFFDIILMDMQMPKMNGTEATKIIRAMDREDAKKIPIVALTANAFVEDIAATTKAGMNAHISKPIDTALLYKTIYNLVQRRAG